MAILWLSSFGISLERRTVLGKALSAPLATMALALFVANIGLLPFQSPVCKYYQGLTLFVRLETEIKEWIFTLQHQSLHKVRMSFCLDESMSSKVETLWQMPS